MNNQITLRDFQVFKTLTVRDVKVEPCRVSATYALTVDDDRTVFNKLIYRYRKPFFDPGSAQDVNLACMMVAQVAINYGLFCEKLVFQGLYDEVDRQFITDMVENTCREIYVHKLLGRNEFIRPEYKLENAEKRKRYTLSEIIFDDTGFRNVRISRSDHSPGYDDYAILSSGGKDSLLTYGIIREIGNPHPVFINESGRHWFTALNAFRAFDAADPNTVKPWCNSDRIFSWMVRQMPFIRKDFSRIRADIYPIRLWTVPVFLFGVIPVALKRSIGNILVGNEYDTTIRDNYEGITHYQALYDQSKYFDNAMTRYYRRKGWNIYQYSILRSMSELLIMKMLVKRYPDLQRHQVSCHAAHEYDGRIYPCGHCEKCRRIVGMLKALDEDPGRCGYTEEQVQEGLQALASRSVKQIGTDAAHLYHLLVTKGLVEQNDFTRHLAKPHPQIEKLRFDRERSNPEDLPDFLPPKLYPLLMSYASGATVLKDRKWEDIDMKKNLPTFK